MIMDHPYGAKKSFTLPSCDASLLVQAQLRRMVVDDVCLTDFKHSVKDQCLN